MTNKEKLIIKRLGYTTFVLYSYIRSNKTFSNKEMEYDLGFSKQSRFRALRNLRNYNIITVCGRSSKRVFTVNKEETWRLYV